MKKTSTEIDTGKINLSIEVQAVKMAVLNRFFTHYNWIFIDNTPDDTNSEYRKTF